MAKQISPLALLTLLLLAMMWGSSFSVIKVALDDFGPLTIAAGRIGLAALLISCLVWWRKDSLPRDRKSWLCLFGIGVLGNAIPFFLISWGEHRVDSGMTAVLMSVIPLTVPIMAHFLTDDEKLSRNMMAGVVIGFIGLIVLVGPNVLLGLGADLISQGAIIFAALCYASASLIARQISKLPIFVVAACSLTIAACIMIPLALLIDQPYGLSPDWHGVVAVAYLGLVPTALANLLLFHIIMTYGVSFLALNNYMVPAFGVAIAAVALGEAVPPTLMAGMGIILVGIFVSSMKRKTG